MSKLPLIASLCLLSQACTTLEAEQDYELETSEANILTMLDQYRAQALEMLSSNAEQARESVCSAVMPILESELAQKINGFASRPAFFMSASVAGGPAVGMVRGVDVVYDLWEHEMSTSQYLGVNVANRIGGEGTIAMGFAGGLYGGVTDWEGTFVSGEVGLTAPIPLLSIGASVGSFVSIPFNIVGVYGKIEVGVELASIALPFLKSLSLSAEAAEWHAWPEANHKIAKSILGRLLGMELQHEDEVIHFKRGNSIVPGYHAASGTRMGASMAISSMPVIGPAAAIELGAIPVVLGVIRDQGYDDAFDVLYSLCDVDYEPATAPQPATGCRSHDGNVSACDSTADDCAYYFCKEECHPRGSANVCSL